MIDKMREVVEPEVAGELLIEDGSVLFSEGEVGRTAYMVVDGLVEIFMKGPDGGKDIVLSELGPGEIVGHMAILDDSPRSASARAKGQTRVRVLDKSQFIKQMGESPELAMQVMHGLAGHVRNANDKIVSSSLDKPIVTDMRRKGVGDGSVLDHLLPWRNQTSRTIASFQPDALEIEHEPVPALARLGGYSIIAFIVAIITWASVSEVDTAVTTRGVTAPTVANISVQATEPGIIRGLFVSEGQHVEVGERLVSLDSTAVDAQIEAAVARLDNLSAKLARMELEFENRMQPVERIPAFGTDEVDNRMQQDLYFSRQQEFSAQVGSFQRNLENMAVRRSSLASEIALAERQLTLLQELEAARGTLFEKQVLSRVQLLSTVFDRIGTEREILELRNRLEQINSERRVTEAELGVYVNQWYSTLTEDILNTREELTQVEEELVTLRQRVGNLEIHAATGAIVLDTHGFAVGSVLRAAEPIITMVPNHPEMLVRLDINAADISKVTVGSEVSIKLDALPFQKHGDLTGSVEFISEDTFDETLLGEPVPVYRARVHINTNNLIDLPPDFRLIPGMNVTGDIRTGKRRVITYFIYPILRWLKTSFREA